MRILEAARHLWQRIVSRTKPIVNQSRDDSIEGVSSVDSNMREEGNVGRQISVSVDAAKYMGRLSPGLYKEVVDICRRAAERQNNLITKKMAQQAVESIYINGNTGQSGGAVNVERQAG